MALNPDLSLAGNCPDYAAALAKLEQLDADEARLTNEYAAALASQESAVLVEAEMPERERRARELLGETVAASVVPEARDVALGRIMASLVATRDARDIIRARLRDLVLVASKAVCDRHGEGLREAAATAARASAEAAEALRSYYEIAKEFRRQGVAHGRLAPLPIEAVGELVGPGGLLPELLKAAATEGYVKRGSLRAISGHVAR